MKNKHVTPVMRRIRRLLRQKKGSSLMEMIVSMMLTAILMTMTTASLLTGYHFYERIQRQNRAVSLAVVLCDDIQAELNKCYGYVYGDPNIDLNCATIYRYEPSAGASLTEPLTLPEQYLPSPPSEKIDLLCFQGISGNNTCLTVSDGRVILYYPQSAGGASWSLGGDAYYGLHVSALNFRWIEKDGSAVVEVRITLANEAEDWSYSATRYVTCQNLSFPNQNALGEYEYRSNCCKTVRYR